jgi:hypothetical protein
MYRKNLIIVLALFAVLSLVSIAEASTWQQPSGTGNPDTPPAANANKPAPTSKRRVSSSHKASKKAAVVRCDPSKQQSADLSGTYKGIVNYPDGGLTGEATLTVTGNQFLLTLGNAAQTGRITAVTTCSYTAASLMLGEPKKAEPGQPPPAPLPVISLRVIKKGSDVTLTSVTGERRTFSFTPQTGK